jgi:hypothetical protein
MSSPMAEDVATAVRQDRLVPNHFDVAPAMVTALRGRRDAWEFLRRFTEQWVTRLDELSGCSDQELTAARLLLGFWNGFWNTTTPGWRYRTTRCGPPLRRRRSAGSPDLMC